MKIDFYHTWTQTIYYIPMKPFISSRYTFHIGTFPIDKEINKNTFVTVTIFVRNISFVILFIYLSAVWLDNYIHRYIPYIAYFSWYASQIKWNMFFLFLCTWGWDIAKTIIIFLVSMMLGMSKNNNNVASSLSQSIIYMG